MRLTQIFHYTFSFIFVCILTTSIGEAAISDGFDFPICPPVATAEIDGDGCYVFQDFGENDHAGEDWNGEGGGNSDWRDPVFAISNGFIVSAQNEGEGWGNVIIIHHDLPDGTSVRSLYGHLDEMMRIDGDVVRGEQIGTIGRGFFYGIDEGTGTPIYDYLAHLHFEIRTDVSIGVVNPYRSDREGWTDASEFISSHRILSPPVEEVSLVGVVPDVFTTNGGTFTISVSPKDENGELISV